MEEMLGTIKMFAGNFAPRGYLLCNGALLGISQNQALFSLLGTIYGGNGQTNFALPNLNGRAPIGSGIANTGKSVNLGEVGGAPTTTLLNSNLPTFASQLNISKGNATTASPSAASSIGVTGTQSGRDFTAVPSFVNTTPDTVINAGSVTFAGANVPIENMSPYLGMNYIICVEGIYPSRP